MYMKNVNDVTGWLSQTTDISKYFVWSPGFWDKESRLYILKSVIRFYLNAHLNLYHWWKYYAETSFNMDFKKIYFFF